MKTTELYLIIKKNTNFVKIGISNNPEERFIYLDTHPEELDLISGKRN